VYQCGETFTRQDSRTSDTAESVRGAFHERDETVTLEYVVGSDFHRGQQLNPGRGEAL
jgi:hypothetical protein